MPVMGVKDNCCDLSMRLVDICFGSLLLGVESELGNGYMCVVAAFSCE